MLNSSSAEPGFQSALKHLSLVALVAGRQESISQVLLLHRSILAAQVSKILGNPRLTADFPSFLIMQPLVLSVPR